MDRQRNAHRPDPAGLEIGLTWLRHLALWVALAGLTACADLADAASGGERIYYLSDCQAGAADGCVAGNNGNSGRSADAPKRDLSGIDINDLPAGSQVLFARGGAWANVSIFLESLDATPTQPLVLGAYGSGPRPLLRAAGRNGVVFGRWNNPSNDGGYTFKSLKFDGGGNSEWGFWLVQNVRNVTLDDVEITGFKIAIHASGGTPHGVTALTVRNSRIVRNSDMGFLGAVSQSTFEGNTFEANNFGGSAFSHAIYLSGGGNNTVRNNRFVRNSVGPSGSCGGGNLTAHGQITNLLIEGNTIEQTTATGGCYGISLTPGYNTPEWFRNTVVRGNTLINLGYVAIAVGAAPGIVVENNRIINTQSTYQAAIQIPTGVEANSPISAGDDNDENAIVRNNIICYASPHANSRGAVANVKGAQLSNNNVLTGAAAATGPCAR